MILLMRLLAPRGKRYWQELFATLKKEKPQIERLSLDLLIPAGH